MTAPDRLRESLHDLADLAQPADLYAGAVRRSRGIARREATVGTAAALVAIAVLASGLWRSRSPGEDPELQVALRSPIPAPSWPASAATPSPAPAFAASSRTRSVASAPQRRKNQPMLAPATAVPRSRSLADLPGRVFYERAGDRPDVVEMSPADGTATTVLADAPSPVGISPDGRRIAYADDGSLLVARTTGGGEPDRLATGVSTANQAPAWSPEGDRLLVGTSTPTILDLETGNLVPLPAGLEGGQHFRWSGDGSKLVFATAYCALQVVGSADGDAVAVPMLGDRQPVDNPDGLAACVTTSVDATGGRVTVPLQTTGGNDGSRTADAVVDTATGDVLALPVRGSVVGAVFDPDGNLLVRSLHHGARTLSLFAPGGELLVQAREPAALGDLALLAYTR